MSNKLTLVHSPATNVEIVKEISFYAPNGYFYIIPDKSNFVEIAKDRSQLEKERNEWIHKYENLLNGLNYWKNKALEK